MDSIVVVIKLRGHQRDIVYDPEGISPALNGVSCEGGYNNMPKIILYEEEDEKIFDNANGR